MVPAVSIADIHSRYPPARVRATNHARDSGSPRAGCGRIQVRGPHSGSNLAYALNGTNGMRPERRGQGFWDARWASPALSLALPRSQRHRDSAARIGVRAGPRGWVRLPRGERRPGGTARAQTFFGEDGEDAPRAAPTHRRAAGERPRPDRRTHQSDGRGVGLRELQAVGQGSGVAPVEHSQLGEDATGGRWPSCRS